MFGQAFLRKSVTQAWQVGWDGSSPTGFCLVGAKLLDTH